jgi:phage protein D
MLPGVLSDKLREPAECVIRIGTSGQEVSDLYPFLVEVIVDTSRDRPAVATLRFETRRDENGQWLVQDAGILAPWEPIVIEAAFGSTTEEVMRGYIREIKADYPEDAGETTVTVECQDESIKLDREHVRHTWGGDAPTSDRVIVSTILGDHGLVLDPQSRDGQGELVINQDDTDIRFLHKRAEANGYELFFREGRVYFGPMRLDASTQETIMVYAGPRTHCYRFSIRDDGHQPDKVAFDRAETNGAGVVTEVVESDLPLLGSEPTDSSGRGLRDFTWRMTRQGGMNETEWLARAQKKANELSMKVKGEGELDGSLYGHVLRVGEPVGVDGVGDRYGGIYYVDTVKHQFNMEGYRQTFTLLRNAYGDNLGSGAGSLLSGIL